MNYKNIILTFTLFLTASVSAVAGNPVTNEPSPEYSEDFYDHSEFEALFNVTGTSLVDRAKDFLGCPYHYGSKGPSSFDCSGFTGYVYKSMNIKIGASSRDQWKEGIAIDDKEDVKVGDLVFFGSNSHYIGHVGIVCEVEGNGDFKFIHSSITRGVTISDIEDDYYARKYRGARRILGDY